MRVPRRQARGVAATVQRLRERQRKDDIARVRDPAKDGGGDGTGTGGGSGSFSGWSPMSDLFTPAAGVEVSPYIVPEYAYDEQFFYLRGFLIINYDLDGIVGGPAAIIDTSIWPTYTIGNFVNPFPFVLPAAASADAAGNSWCGPVALDGASVTRTGELLINIVGGYMTLVSGDDFAYDSFERSVSISLDNIALPWGARPRL